MKAIIVSGFLGSGKTELVKRIILKEKNVLCIENEIGDYNIDSKLTNCNVIEINGGSISNINLGLLKKALNRLNNETLIIETSGASKLNNVIIALNEKKIKPYVISVIDAVKFDKCEKLSSNTLENLENSSSIILNKIDLVNNSKELIKKLKHFNKNVYGTINSNIDVNKLYTNKIMLKDKIKNKYIPYIFWRIKNNLGLKSKNEQHEDINAYTYERHGIVHIKKIEKYLIKKKFLRAKGIIKTKTGNVIFNFSNNIFTTEKTKNFSLNKIVIIDNNIFSKRKVIRTELNKCIKKSKLDILKDIFWLWKNQQKVVQRYKENRNI